MGARSVEYDDVDVDVDGDANDDVDARCVDVAREPAMYRACVVTDVRIVGGREVTREGVERRAFWRMIYMIIHSWIRVRA